MQSGLRLVVVYNNPSATNKKQLNSHVKQKKQTRKNFKEANYAKVDLIFRRFIFGILPD